MVKLDKRTQFGVFSILAPRYHDKTVLLAKHKVREHNKILFTDAPSLGTEPYYLAGKTIKKYKIDSNGAIPCYAVPVSELDPLELTENSVMELW